MTEKELIKLIIDLAQQQQPAVYVLHFPDSRRIQGDPGLPDLLLLGEYRLIWRELKCDGTELRRDQRAWRWRRTSAGGGTTPNGCPATGVAGRYRRRSPR